MTSAGGLGIMAASERSSALPVGHSAGPAPKTGLSPRVIAPQATPRFQSILLAHGLPFPQKRAVAPVPDGEAESARPLKLSNHIGQTHDADHRGLPSQSRAKRQGTLTEASVQPAIPWVDLQVAPKAAPSRSTSDAVRAHAAPSGPLQPPHETGAVAHSTRAADESQQAAQAGNAVRTTAPEASAVPQKASAVAADQKIPEVQPTTTAAAARVLTGERQAEETISSNPTRPIATTPSAHESDRKRENIVTPPLALPISPEAARALLPSIAAPTKRTPYASSPIPHVAESPVVPGAEPSHVDRTVSIPPDQPAAGPSHAAIALPSMHANSGPRKAAGQPFGSEATTMQVVAHSSATPTAVPTPSNGSLRDALSGTTTATTPPTHELFTAMDGDAPLPAPTWTHATASHAEAGFQDPALGWVGVRSRLNAGEVHAAIIPSSATASEALSPHLAGLTTFLSEQHTPIATWTLSSPETTTLQTGEQGTGQNAHRDRGQPAEATGNRAPASGSRLTEEAHGVASRFVELGDHGGHYISLLV
ncbi:MAG TPA: hypothetical protein VHW46_09750 [Terracidiphilus sp.]|nr:hypothetical protein [Terracidiphilus sp.]